MSTHLESAPAPPLLSPDGTHVDGSLGSGIVLPPLPVQSTPVQVSDNPLANALRRATTEQNAKEATPRGLPQVPGYEIQAELGRGGMGVVYQGWDAHLKRAVAIKFLRAERADHPDLRRRFQAEAEATARLQHPHLVQIHGFGEVNGQPYLVQEYVAGGSLSQHLLHQPQLPQEAAALVASLARAMDYAHQQGIIHRDLKPANILLSFNGASAVRASGASLSEAIPKITDFGLAKLLDADDGLTKSEALIGTPNYMAPEQAGARLPDGRRAPVTPSADIYALGAILYELLTGRPPFQGQTVWDTLDQVIRDDPVPPCRLQPRLSRDLETVCLKCLQKEPARRYARAGELADDLARYLRGEPVHARPTGAVERGLKWSRRHPALATLYGVSAAALLTILVGGMIYNSLLNAALVKAQTNEANALAARKEAEQRFQQTLEAVDRLLVRFADRRLADLPETAEIRAEVLQDALQFYRNMLPSGDTADPRVRLEMAATLRRIGSMEGFLQMHAEAEAHLRQAATLLERLEVERPGDRQIRRTRCLTLLVLSQELWNTARAQEAEEPLQLCLELTKAFAQPPDSDAEARSFLAMVWNSRAVLDHTLGRLDAAVTAYEQSRQTWEGLLQVEPKNVNYRQGLARALHNRSSLLLTLGRAREAEPGQRKALELFEGLVRDHAHHLPYQADLTACLLIQAHLVNHPPQGGAEALRLMQRALAIRQRLAAAYPRLISLQNDLAEAHHQLGCLAVFNNRTDEAETHFREAVCLRRQLVTENPKETTYHSVLAQSLINLALMLSGPRKEEALALSTQAETLLEPMARQDRWNWEVASHLSAAYANHGNLLCDLGHLQQGMAVYSRGIDLLSDMQHHQPGNKTLCSNLAKLHRGRALAGQAANEWARVRADWDAAVALGDQHSAYVLGRVNQCLRDGDHATAAEDARRLTADITIDRQEVARIHSKLVLMVLRDRRMPFFLRLYEADWHSRSAVSLLRQAKATLFVQPKETQRTWAETILNDPDFTPLQGREDFHRLIGSRKLRD